MVMRWFSRNRIPKGRSPFDEDDYPVSEETEELTEEDEEDESTE